MAWQDRVRQGAYTGPGGTRLTFDFEDVSRDFEKRGTAFDFPGVTDSYVQQNGHTSRKYPLRCFFTGDDHDQIATAFETLLIEDGVGRLEHPFYGTFDVVPFGTISRRDDLRRAANQTVIEVTFWTTIRVLYPSSQTDAQSEVSSAIEGFNAQAAQQFANSMRLQNALNKQNAKATTKGLLGGISDSLQSISDTTSSVRAAFADLQSEVNEGIDVLIGQPLLLAQQISQLIQAPGRAVAGIQSRLEGYGRLADSIFGSDAGQPLVKLATGSFLLTRVERIANDFRIADHMATSAVTGAVVAVSDDPTNAFATRAEAIDAADTIIDMFDSVVDKRESGFEALESTGVLDQLDTGDTHQALQEAVALAAGMLVGVSFGLVSERRIVLDRARTIIDLSAELYGSVDDKLDLLINSNNLTGSEILELPKGKSIVYYA